ncbi:MAG: 50S ribosomal protein L25 [Leptospiraceae bacterium]|nr:50S ribosomal protein L25 [Leptospiraceae bacterium]MDW7976794.1 50S ribosomal protein L25 [Leptospiraceae bacterium]
MENKENMENTKKIRAERRTEFGKNASRRLRRAGKIPANILEKGKSTPVVIQKSEFMKLLSQGLLPSMKIQVEFENEVFEVLPKEIQREPVTGEIEHVDFYKMTPNHKFHLHIPVELVGVAKGVRAGGALEHFVQMLKIRTTPENLKEKIEVDITNLNVGEAIRLSDLNLPKEWDVLIQGNPIICKVAQSRATIKAAQEETKETKETKK